jgi:hypothetical protein
MNRIDGLVPDVDWRRPEDVVERVVDPLSGMLATPYCPNTREEVFVAGTDPESVCLLHAGSGELSPFWPEPPVFEHGEQPPASMDPRQAAEERRRRQERERENSIRKLLRRIFGDD